MSTPDVMRKRVVAKYRAAEREHERRQRYRRWRCFWTRPFGHAWVRTAQETKQCVGCAHWKRLKDNEIAMATWKEMTESLGVDP